MAEWKSSAAYPWGNGYGSGIVQVNGKIYFIGISNRYIYIYDIASGTYSQGADLPTATQLMAVTVVGNDIYCFGGYVVSSDRPTANAYKYSTTTNIWTSLRSMPETRGSMGCAAIGDNIYLFGARQYSTEAYRKNVYVYNISSDTYVTVSGIIPVDEWDDMGCAPYNNEIYLFGGRGTQGGVSGVLSSTYKYDISTSSFSSLTTMPGSVTQSFPVELGGKIYIAGYMSNSVYVYDIASNIYEPSLAIPAGSAQYYPGGATKYRNVLYLAGSNDLWYIDLSQSIVANPSPTGGFHDEQSPITFSWLFQTFPDDDSIRQKSFSFQWRASTTGTVYPVNQTTSNQFYTAPANTFPNGSFQWRVMVTGTNDIPSDWTDWYTISTVDPQPRPPIGLSPSSGRWNASSRITLSWVHRPGENSNTPQSAFEIQVSYDGLPADSTSKQWINLTGKQSTGNQYCTLPENTLKPTDESGTVAWRVRTYNSDNVASEWSAAETFNVVSAPNSPVITGITSGTNYPAVSWTSSGQTGYRVQYLLGNTIIHDSGEQYGPAVYSYQVKPPDTIPNGTYTVQVMVVNDFEYWSQPGMYQVVINARKRLVTNLSAEEGGAFVRLTWETEVTE